MDSGASDGVEVSNTLVLESQFGWDGICVEPNQGFFAQLQRNRRCRCVNICLYDRDGEVEFLEASTLGGIVESYAGPLLEQAKALHRTSEQTVLRRCISVRTFLAAFGVPDVIDYWSLDTEGSELAILQAFPFSEYQVKVLTVEHNWLPVRDTISDLLHAQGYRRVAELGCDDGYVHESVLSGRVGTQAWRSRALGRRRSWLTSSLTVRTDDGINDGPTGRTGRSRCLLQSPQTVTTS